MPPLEAWAQYMAALGHSPATIAVYVRTVRALAGHAHSEPEAVTRQHVIAFLARGVKPWTRLTYWKAVNRWSAFLRDFSYDPDSDLTRGIPRPRTPDPVARPVNDDVVAKLLAAKLSPRARAYARLALYAGLRVHEIAKLRGEDFDLTAGWLMVTGKGGHTAPVPIHPEVHRLAAAMPEYGYWFPSPSDVSKPVGPVAVSQTIKAALASVGCKATAHQLRDTAATKMQRQVKDIRVTQSMLRHRSVRSTQKYCGVADDALLEAVLSLDWTEPAA